MRITRLARSDCGLPLYSISLTTCVSDVMMQPALVVAIPCTHTACPSELSELASVRVFMRRHLSLAVTNAELAGSHEAVQS